MSNALTQLFSLNRNEERKWMNTRPKWINLLKKKKYNY